ncbi:hypothetical protein DL96DRAFT_1597429 [Flagelloscypha sp. PMI_526]|nr:hypothetical protein DL96DRAFT_1597429 [Flagelloscypha sp. PMI_526]
MATSDDACGVLFIVCFDVCAAAVYDWITLRHTCFECTCNCCQCCPDDTPYDETEDSDDEREPLLRQQPNRKPPMGSEAPS